MCKFEANVDSMTYENCNLFRRSFTTAGLGYTFNNRIEKQLYKEDFRSTAFLLNSNRHPTLMKSTYSDHSLTVVVDINAEEVEKYEENEIMHQPKEVIVSLHNPKEPADTKFIPATSTSIPLGYTTTFFITPKAREIDDSGKELTESERNCRLDQDTEDLDVFNVYSKIACLFECKMKQSMEMCGCVPWNYPVNRNDQVS